MKILGAVNVVLACILMTAWEGIAAAEVAAAANSLAEAPANCKSWFDGCNNCGRQQPGAPLMCTRMFCGPETRQPPACREFFPSSGVRAAGEGANATLTRLGRDSSVESRQGERANKAGGPTLRTFADHGTVEGAEAAGSQMAIGPSRPRSLPFRAMPFSLSYGGLLAYSLPLSVLGVCLLVLCLGLRRRLRKREKLLPLNNADTAAGPNQVPVLFGPCPGFIVDLMRTRLCRRLRVVAKRVAATVCPARKKEKTAEARSAKSNPLGTIFGISPGSARKYRDM